jgi:hypothetical protein
MRRRCAAAVPLMCRAKPLEGLACAGVPAA